MMSLDNPTKTQKVYLDIRDAAYRAGRDREKIVTPRCRTFFEHWVAEWMPVLLTMERVTGGAMQAAYHMALYADAEGVTDMTIQEAWRALPTDRPAFDTYNKWMWALRWVPCLDTQNEWVKSKDTNIRLVSLKERDAVHAKISAEHQRAHQVYRRARPVTTAEPLASVA